MEQPGFFQIQQKFFARHALDIKTEYEWELYGHKVNVDALSLSLFARNENNKYVPRTYFDVSSTDISSDNYNENYFPDELMLALSSAFIASDIKLYAVNSEAVDFEEWCQLNDPPKMVHRSTQRTSQMSFQLYSS